MPANKNIMMSASITACVASSVKKLFLIYL
jgi:hypothetical protein